MKIFQSLASPLCANGNGHSSPPIPFFVIINRTSAPPTSRSMPIAYQCSPDPWHALAQQVLRHNLEGSRLIVLLPISNWNEDFGLEICLPSIEGSKAATRAVEHPSCKVFGCSISTFLPLEFAFAISKADVNMSGVT